MKLVVYPSVSSWPHFCQVWGKKDFPVCLSRLHCCQCDSTSILIVGIGSMFSCITKSFDNKCFYTLVFDIFNFVFILMVGIGSMFSCIPKYYDNKCFYTLIVDTFNFVFYSPANLETYVCTYHGQLACNYLRVEGRAEFRTMHHLLSGISWLSK